MQPTRLLVTDAAAQPPRQATVRLIMTLGRVTEGLDDIEHLPEHDEADKVGGCLCVQPFGSECACVYEYEGCCGDCAGDNSVFHIEFVAL